MKKLNFQTKGVTINLSDVFYKFKKNINFVILFSLFCCGLIIGCVCVLINENFASYYEAWQNNNGIASAFISRILIDLILLTMNFCMGFCCVGMPFITISPVIFGFFTGSVFASYLSLYTAKGIGIFILLKMPSLVISAVCIILSCIISYKMSDRLIKNTFFNIRENFSIKKYLTINFLLTAFSILAAVTDIICHKLFSGLII